MRGAIKQEEGRKVRRKKGAYRKENIRKDGRGNEREVKRSGEVEKGKNFVNARIRERRRQRTDIY